MAERIVNSPILVVRDGKQVEPVIGKPFDFTDSEIKEIEKLTPSAITKPVVEAAEVTAKK
jgi:hypothetical protein